MNIKQKILKTLYPLIMLFSKSATGKGKILRNEKMVKPKTSFHELKATLNTGQVLDFSQFKNKKVLLVNTASNCGYTGQFEELQELYEKFQDKIALVAFPANDFQEQEKGNDSEIAQFCKLNYGVTFPLSQKSIVVRDQEQNQVYQWLTHEEQNGWNSHEPDWNFSKYLIDEKGILTHYFGPAVSPLSSDIVKELE